MQTQMTQVKITDIQWPAIVKLAQHDELLYLAHQADWLALASLHQRQFVDADLLLDSLGEQYLIRATPTTIHENPIGELPNLLKQQQKLSLTDFIKWVQKHANAIGQCCVAKLAFTTFAQGMEIVHSLDEQV